MAPEQPHSAPRLLGYRTAFWVLVLAYVLPLWLVRCLPCVDLPQHLDFVNILRNIGNPHSGYSSTYTLQLYPAHNVLHLLFVYLASFPLGIELANKLFFTAYVVGFALALDYLLRVLGANRWLGLLGMLFVYNLNFFWGFPGLLAAFPLLLLALGLELEWLKGGGRSAARWILLALTWILAFLAHPYGFALTLLLFGLVLILRERKPQPPARLGILLATLAPVLALFVVPWMLTVIPKVRSDAPLQVVDFYRQSPPVVRLLLLLTRVGSHDSWSQAGAGLILAAVILRLIFVVVRRNLRALRSRPVAVVSVLAVACFACYLFLPEILGRSSVVDERFVAFGFVLFAVLLAVLPKPTGPASRVIAPAVLTVLLLNAANVTWRFVAFDRVARPGLKLIAGLPANKTLLGLVYADPGIRLFGYRTLMHFSSYYPVLKGGYAGLTFAEIPYSPIRTSGQWKFLEHGQEVRPWQFAFPEKWRDYDFVLVRGAPRPQDSVYIAQCSLLASDDQWRVYAVPGDTGSQHQSR